jgi:hypothetical protein
MNAVSDKSTSECVYVASIVLVTSMLDGSGSLPLLHDHASWTGGGDNIASPIVGEIIELNRFLGQNAAGQQFRKQFFWYVL